jgi:predicted DsbA family dithiol-disulfide isomerase
MLSFRIAAAVAALLLSSKLTTCRSPAQEGGGAAPEHEAAKPVDLPGINTTSLTAREKSEWSGYVSALLAPCPDQPVSLADCVRDKRACKACVPAAEFLLAQVKQGKARSQVEALYRVRFAPDQIKNIDLGGSPAKGAPKPTVTIVEWADFECPACAAARPVLDGLLEKHPNDVRLVFKHFPLSIHPNAETAARAAVAAAKQGKFWQMHRLLFENQDRGLDRANIDRLAREAGLDMKQFAHDVESEEAADLVMRDRKLGEKFELGGTPTLFINGRQFRAGDDFAGDLDDWVKLEMELGAGQAAK